MSDKQHEHEKHGAHKHNMQTDAEPGKRRGRIEPDNMQTDAEPGKRRGRIEPDNMQTDGEPDGRHVGI